MTVLPSSFGVSSILSTKFAMLFFAERRIVAATVCPWCVSHPAHGNPQGTVLKFRCFRFFVLPSSHLQGHQMTAVHGNSPWVRHEDSCPPQAMFD